MKSLIGVIGLFMSLQAFGAGQICGVEGTMDCMAGETCRGGTCQPTIPRSARPHFEIRKQPMISAVLAVGAQARPLNK